MTCDLSSIPVCSGHVYPGGECLCHMDQCLEAVRYHHMERCGNTTAPPPPQPPLEVTIEDSQDNSTTSNDTQYDIEKHLALMFEWVTFSSYKYHW